jgi:hypothetical protein
MIDLKMEGGGERERDGGGTGTGKEGRREGSRNGDGISPPRLIGGKDTSLPARIWISRRASSSLAG